METIENSLDRLLQNLHAELGKDSTPAEKYAMHNMLATYIMDAARPRGGGDNEILKHITERTVPNFAYGMNRRAAALDLRYSCGKGKIVLKSKDGDVAYFANDVENSGLHLVDVATSRALERHTGLEIQSTYNLFMRCSSICARRPYKDCTDNQHREYVRRTQFQQSPLEYNMSVNDMFDSANGLPKPGILINGKTIVLTEPLPFTSAAALFEQCEAGKACLRFSVSTQQESRELLAKYAEVMLHGNNTLQYTPLECHPAYPLVSGPECIRALATIDTLLDHWIALGKLKIDLSKLNPTTELASVATPKEQAPVVADVIRDNPPQKDANIPADIWQAYTTVLSMPENKIRAVLLSWNFTSSNPDIWTMDGTNHLPSLVMKACKQAVLAMTNPTAGMVLSRVHWALTNKDLYLPTVAARLPKDPWKAAVFLVCRHRETYGVKNPNFANVDWSNSPAGTYSWATEVEAKDAAGLLRPSVSGIKPVLASHAGPLPSAVAGLEELLPPGSYMDRGRPHDNRQGGRSRSKSRGAKSGNRGRSKSRAPKDATVTFNDSVQQLVYTQPRPGPTVTNVRTNKGKGRGKGRSNRGRNNKVDIGQLAAAVTANSQLLQQMALNMTNTAGASVSPTTNQ